MSKLLRLVIVLVAGVVASGAGEIKHPSALRELPFTPCSLSGGPNECPGLLSADFIAHPNIETLKKVFQDSIKGWQRQGQDTYRYGKKNAGPACKGCQHAQTYYNDANPNIELYKPMPRPIVVGAIRWKSLVDYKDVLYDVGKNLPDEKWSRLTVIVAYHKEDTVYVKNGLQAHWTMFAVSKPPGGAWAISAVDSGTISKCEESHTDTGTVFAGMRSCPELRAITAFAKQNGVTRSDLLEASNCELAALSWGEGNPADQCQKQRDRRVRALVQSADSRGSLTAAGLNAFLSRLNNEEEGPYWFSCSVGCCTADPI